MSNSTNNNEIAMDINFNVIKHHISNSNNSNINNDDTTIINNNNDLNITTHNKDCIDMKNGIRILTIPRDTYGFGFNVRGPISEGGQMKSINGELYGPMQHISAVLKGGAADKAGLLVGDKILEINGVNVEGYAHRTVINMLRSSPDPLLVAVLTPDAIHHDIKDEDDNSITNGYTINDINCNDVNSQPLQQQGTLPQQRLQKPLQQPQQQQAVLHQQNHHHISIPDYQEVGYRGSSYIVFNIYLNGRLICCRRYSHFDKLYKILKSQFPQIHFMTLPGKKLFHLNDVQLDNRRRGLERFLVSACSMEEVFASEVIKQFLNLNQSDSSSLSSPHANGDDNDDKKMTTTTMKVMMKVLMPDHSLMEVEIDPDNDTEQVYAKLTNHLCLRTDVLPFFALFEIHKGGFERKLAPNEFPYYMYLNQSSDNLASCISFNKWIFSKKKKVPTATLR